MRLAELYARTCEQARASKRAAATRPLVVRISLWRGDREVAQVFLEETDSEQMRSALSMATLGLSADRLSLMFEGWSARCAVNPSTGEPWQIGEMGSYAAIHGVGGAVGESVVVHVATASDDVRSGSLPFTIVGGTVVWEVATEMDHAEGAVPEVIAAALDNVGQASIFHAQLRRLPMAAGRSEAWAQAVTDTMTAAVLTERCGAVVLLCAGAEEDERREVIDAFTGQSGQGRSEPGGI